MAIAVIRTGLVAVGLVWALCIQTVMADGGPSFVKPSSRAAGLEVCVEPTDYMRRNHMELIKHQRDATVHRGVRGTRYSLAGCIDCHASKGSDGHPVAVDAPHQFCNACHAFAAVDVNCFDCHAAIPRGGPLSESAAHRAAGREPGLASGQAAIGEPGHPAARLVQTGEGQ
jgi:hypothetical protein